MSGFSFRRLLPLGLLAASGLAIAPCVARGRPSYGHGRHNDRH